MYCGKCGAELNEKGLCPNCDKSSRSKKKIVCISVIALFLIISILIAIIIFNNNDPSETDKEINKSIYSEQAEKTSNINVNNYKELTYYSYNDFSEELAWINFADDEKSYYGCIDKTGKIVFSFDANGISEVTDFSNGYAYISYQDCMKIIDKTGNIVGIYNTDENNKVVAYGDGNIFISEHIADYNSSIYNYSIINSKGNVIKEFSLFEYKDYYKFDYFGNGIFGYRTSEFEGYNIYFPEIDEWVHSDCTFYFDSDTTIYKIEYGEGYDSNDGFRGNLCLIDTNGKITKIKIPKDLGWNWINNRLTDNRSILQAHSYDYNYFIKFDLNDYSFEKMPEEYSAKINYDYLPQVEFYNGKIALPWNGSDDKSYIAIFDTEWNLIANPIPIDKFADYNDNLLYSYSDGRLIVENESSTIVYDENCNEVFNSNDCGYSKLSEYKNGVSKVLDESIPTYLDEKGNKLFEKIDTSIFV